MTPLRADQLEEFFRLWSELEPLSPKARQATINKLADQTVAELLRNAFAEPPSFRGLRSSDQIGKYVLKERLGMGGQGEVWLAQQDLGGQLREVAVKLIRPDGLLGGNAANRLERFHREITLLKDLRGEGIAQLYDAGTAKLPGCDREIPYFVMEYVPGKTVTETLRPRDVRTQVACFQKVCAAVQRAHNHREGVLHLDLKPHNVLVIEEGGELTPKVLDFGLARCFDPVRRLAVAHFGWGTLPYMAPEQLDPELGGADFRTDVHALGVMLFQVLTGQWPHDVPEGNPSGYVRAIGKGPRRELRKVVNPPPTGLTDAQWESLEAIVGRAMAVKREKRYDKPCSLAKALAKWSKELPTGPPETPVAITTYNYVEKGAIVHTVKGDIHFH